MAVSKLIKGKGFKGAMRYASGKENAEEICAVGVFSKDHDIRAAEMRAVAASARTTRPVFHASLALPPGQQATDDQWQTAGESYLKEMGFDLDKSQYVITRHRDTDHDHIHIIANRVQLDGRTVSENRDFKRSHEATRAAEKAAGLEAFQGKVTEKGTLANLRAQVREAAEGNPNINEFRQRLSAHGITLKESRQSTGRLSGLSFQTADGRIWKGSALGKEFSASGLQKQGVALGLDSTRHNTPTPKAATYALSGTLAARATQQLVQAATQQQPQRRNRGAEMEM